jgi:spore coat protein U domain-containing protein, fimbrial subunit CupE1/2/3/6
MTSTPALFLSAVLVLFAPAAAASISCVGSGIGMSLGTYLGDTSAPVDSIGSFRLNCTRNGGASTIPVTMGIGASASTGSITARALHWLGGPDLLHYNIYRDATRLSVWGQTIGVDTVTQTVTVPDRGSATLTFTLFGRIDPLQNVHVGTYADALVIIITF